MASSPHETYVKIVTALSSESLEESVNKYIKELTSRATIHDIKYQIACDSITIRYSALVWISYY